MSESVTLQHILERFADPSNLDPRRRQVCRHLQSCRTAALGGRQLQCDDCGSAQRWYHSCRDRHCPQCQGRATHRWAERQHDHLLPVRYYHLVFTLPHELNGWVHLHPEVIYRLLFEATWGTLKAFGRDPRRLGGELGMSAVLHTWGSTSRGTCICTAWCPAVPSMSKGNGGRAGATTCSQSRRYRATSGAGW